MRSSQQHTVRRPGFDRNPFNLQMQLRIVSTGQAGGSQSIVVNASLVKTLLGYFRKFERVCSWAAATGLLLNPYPPTPDLFTLTAELRTHPISPALCSEISIIQTRSWHRAVSLVSRIANCQLNFSASQHLTMWFSQDNTQPVLKRRCTDWKTMGMAYRGSCWCSIRTSQQVSSPRFFESQIRSFGENISEKTLKGAGNHSNKSLTTSSLKTCHCSIASD